VTWVRCTTYHQEGQQTVRCLLKGQPMGFWLQDAGTGQVERSLKIRSIFLKFVILSSKAIKYYL